MKTLTTMIVAMAVTLVAAPAMALERINDSGYVLGKGRSHVRNICAEADGTWLEGSCLFPELGAGVMLEWRNGRVTAHTLMMKGTTYGYTILRGFRESEGKADFTASSDGCDIYGWNNVQGMDFVIMICAGMDNSGVQAKRAQ